MQRSISEGNRLKPTHAYRCGSSTSRQATIVSASIGPPLLAALLVSSLLKASRLFILLLSSARCIFNAWRHPQPCQHQIARCIYTGASRVTKYASTRATGSRAAEKIWPPGFCGPRKAELQSGMRPGRRCTGTAIAAARDGGRCREKEVENGSGEVRRREHTLGMNWCSTCC